MISWSFDYAAGVASFRFLSNHGMALLTIAHDPNARMRDIAEVLGITERATQRIVADLIAAEYVLRERRGRRNAYTVRTDLSINLPDQRDIDLGSLLSVLLPPGTTEQRRELIEQ